MIQSIYSLYRLALNLARFAWYWPAANGLHQYALHAARQALFARLEIHAALRDLDLSWVSSLPIWGKR